MNWGAVEVGIVVGSALTGAVLVTSLVSFFVRLLLGLAR